MENNELELVTENEIIEEVVDDSVDNSSAVVIGGLMLVGALITGGIVLYKKKIKPYIESKKAEKEIDDIEDEEFDSEFSEGEVVEEEVIEAKTKKKK